MAALTGYNYFMQNALRYGWAVPTGVILMWSGAIADIPTGYVFCDGNNDTPDLRDKFVVAAKQDDAGVAKTNITGALTVFGNILDHQHAFDDGGHVHGSGGSVGAMPPDGDLAWDHLLNSASTAASGDTDFVRHIPPYYALAFIMKT